MPYPARVTREQIIARAIKLIERKGELSLHDLAHKLGIKTPSLYRYFDSRERLIAEVGLAGFRNLAAYIRSATADDPNPKAAAIATRRFANEHPALYRVMNESDSSYEDRAEASDVTLDVLTASLGGPVSAEALLAFQPVFRAVRAFIHGFIMLEISGQFTSSGDLDQAFELGLNTLLSAFQSQVPVELRKAERTVTDSVGVAARSRRRPASRPLR